MPKLTFKAERWPWQIRTHRAFLSGPNEVVGKPYGWKRVGGMGRFGGGFEYNLGFETSGWHPEGITVLVYLLYGYIVVRYRTAKGIALDKKREEERAARKAASTSL